MSEAAPRPDEVVVTPKERMARKALLVGSALLLVGVGLVGVGPSDAGGVLVVVALLATIYGVHSFGRLGPDEP